MWSKSNICFTTISDPEQPCMCCFGWIQWQLFKCFYWLYFCFLRDIILKEDGNNNKCKQSIIFKLVSYCFEETIGFEVKASFVSRPISRLIRWYNKRILIKGYSVPRDFSWIENYKLSKPILKILPVFRKFFLGNNLPKQYALNSFSDYLMHQNFKYFLQN